MLVVWDYGVGFGGSDEGQQAFYDLVDEINARFEEANPGVTVDQQHFGYTDYDAKVATATASGTAPDVAWSYNDINWESSLPLDTFITDEFAAEITLIDGQIIASGDGKPYMLPWGTYQGLWMYNKAIFEENGLTPPETQEEFLEICDALNAAGVVPVRYTMGDPYTVSRMGALMGGQLIEDISEWNSLALDYTSDEYRTGIETILGMVDRDCWGPNPSAKGLPGESDSAFRAGETAILFANNQITVSSYEESIGEGNLGVFLQPSIDGGAASMDASAAGGFTIPNSTKVPDLAWKYIEFYSAAEQQLLAWESINQLPNNSSVIITSDQEVYTQQLDWAKDPAFHIGSWPITGLEFDAYEALAPELIAGRLSIDDFLASVQEARVASREAR